MARQKLDVLLVRNDAPVQRMRLGPWLLYFFALFMLLILAALAGGGYLLFQQNQALEEMVKDNRRLRLAAQNLETIVRDLQDRAFVSNLPEAPPPPPPPPRQAAAPPPSPPAPQAKPEEKKPEEAKPAAPDNGSAPTPSAAQAVEPWPTSADWVEVRNIRRKKSGRDLLVYFDVANKMSDKGSAEGYVTVLLRSDRKGSPWVEAWPPARLTPLGRPEDPKRGAPFTVQRYKRFRARFALVDKEIEAVEFLIYDKQGELALFVREAADAKKSES